MEGLVIGGNFAFQNGLGLSKKNSLKHLKHNSLKKLKTANSNSPWAYILERLIIGRIFASDIWGAYFRLDLFLGGLVIRILE